MGTSIEGKTDAVEISKIQLDSWEKLQKHVELRPYSLPDYIWRGQRDASWKLESGLDRYIRASNPKRTPEQSEGIATRHLERFKLASRGRRGAAAIQATNDDAWWALAQHNAMLTPLLDWTDSPFVALYFAFEKEQPPESGERAVWALSQTVEVRGDSQRPIFRRSPGKIDFIRPQQDENSRLLNQAGLFTKVPSGTTVERWLADNGAVIPGTIALTEFVIPDTDRKECLRLLNRMNINHLSLFPDLYGAGKHCNNVLQIENY
jgi:hypothetical protein